MTMCETSILFGGSVRQSVDMATGEICARESEDGRNASVSAYRPNRSEAQALSTVHNEPKGKVIYRKDASVLTVRTRGKEEQEGQEEREVAKRGKVTSFTRKSAGRLRFKIGEIKRDCMPLFVTLTYPNEYSSEASVFKGHYKAFIKRLLRKFPAAAGVWKLEPQGRGAPHFHLLVWGVEDDDLTMFVPGAWYEIVGSDDPNHLLWHKGKLGNGNKHCVQRIEKLGGVNWYISKYMSKEVVGQCSDWGRWWGTFNWDSAPVGQEVEVLIPLKVAYDIIRYQRRFSKIKSRAYPSLTILCNASQWVNRLL